MPKSLDGDDRAITRRRLMKGVAAAVLAPATLPTNSLAMIVRSVAVRSRLALSQPGHQRAESGLDQPGRRGVLPPVLP